MPVGMPGRQLLLSWFAVAILVGVTADAVAAGVGAGARQYGAGVITGVVAGAASGRLSMKPPPVHPTVLIGTTVAQSLHTHLWLSVTC